MAEKDSRPTAGRSVGRQSIADGVADGAPRRDLALMQRVLRRQLRQCLGTFQPSFARVSGVYLNINNEKSDRYTDFSYTMLP